MKKLLSEKEYKIMSEEMEKVTYTCKCSHRVMIPNWKDKEICSYCGNYVFKDKKDEFKFRVKEKMIRR